MELKFNKVTGAQLAKLTELAASAGLHPVQNKLTIPSQGRNIKVMSLKKVVVCDAELKEMLGNSSREATMEHTALCDHKGKPYFVVVIEVLDPFTYSPGRGVETHCSVPRALINMIWDILEVFPDLPENMVITHEDSPKKS